MIAAGFAALMAIMVFLIPEASAAIDSVTMDAALSVFVMFCTLLVFMTSPAIALFYGEMLKRHSMTSTIAQCIGVMVVVGFIWWVVGHSLALTGDVALVGKFATLRERAINLLGERVRAPLRVFALPEHVCRADHLHRPRSHRWEGQVLHHLRVPSHLVYPNLCAHGPHGFRWKAHPLSRRDRTPNVDSAGETAVYICSSISGMAVVITIVKRSGKISRGGSYNVLLCSSGASSCGLAGLDSTAGPQVDSTKSSSSPGSTSSWHPAYPLSSGSSSSIYTSAT